MIYKGYEGIASFDEEADLFHGDVINTRDVITFQGRSVKDLRKAFRDSVDDYLAFCRARGEEPEKPFSGKLVLRIAPELHKRITIEARRRSQSLNAYIAERLEVRTEA